MTCDVEESFRAFVRIRREHVGLSQAALAKQLTDRGRPFIQSQIAKIEAGARSVSLAEAVALTAVLGDTIENAIDNAGERIATLRDDVLRLAAEAEAIASDLRHVIDTERSMRLLPIVRSSSGE